MAISCGECGAGLRDSARFCDACGSPVAAPDSHAEYKQVTVLFADVVHSMDIAATVGPERLREIMGEVFRRSSTVVRRYGGTVDKFTGDGIMAVFGAPVALEDHAARACRAALDIQTDAAHLAAEVDPRDDITLQLRIGLNSGEVITGEIGSGPMSYTAVGEQVGMAQRMESVAPPGGVMVSDSTARLVDAVAILADTEQVHIKGTDAAVPAHRLLGMDAGRRADRAETAFVGRQWEMGTLDGVLARSISGRGSIVGLVGPPGIGKSRLVRELSKQAKDAGAEVSWTYCESHTSDLPFHAAAGLLRSTFGVDGLDDQEARERVRARFASAEEDDVVLLDDLLGIGAPTAALPQIDPDARRRRLASMVKAVALTRTTPIVYVIEDAHWIDGISETMLADFLTVVPQTPSLVLITYRPEYAGALAHAPRSQTIALEPLDESQMRALGAELLGADSSIAELADLVAERAAGNPFFAEEIVRDLSERDVLVGGRGCYLCAEPLAEVHVPRTLQAVIAARIDRLDSGSKRTLNAAAVAGSRFTPAMLTALGADTNLGDLLAAELIDQTVFSPEPEYVFRHALVRAVAYESQLKSDRAQLHTLVAAALDQDDQNAALIAEHLEAAGDLHAAYQWHMRAAAWSTNRDTAAALLCWERATIVADSLPRDDPRHLAMRIAPRMSTCAVAWRRFHPDISARFGELRELCSLAGDKLSLAIAMAGMTLEHVLHDRIREASSLASEYMAIVESLGDPSMTLELSWPACVAKIQAAEASEALRWAQAAIECAEAGHAPRGLLLEAPLAPLLAFRGSGRWMTGASGWQQDFDRAIGLARVIDSVSGSGVYAYKYLAVPRLLVPADQAALAELSQAMESADRASDDMAVVLLRMTHSYVLTFCETADRQAGFDTLAQLRETCTKERFALNALPIMDVHLARGKVERGDTDGALQVLRSSIETTTASGNLSNLDVLVATLVELLLDRGAHDDLSEAQAAVDLCTRSLSDDVWAQRDMTTLRLHALLAKARGDAQMYRSFKEQYLSAAKRAGFPAHIAVAEAMP
ncbi:cyclase [Mycolicibacterium moriokaense]|nr:cyclase [Mycolicibacterium moriokaense]